MRPITIRILTAVLGIATFSLLPFGATYAQSTSQVITISPASAEMSADPGGSVSKSLDIINTGTDNYTVKLSTAPYSVTGLSYDPNFNQIPGTLNASDWITLDNASVELESNTKVAVEYAVTVPADTPAGGYYAVIFAETSEENTGEGGIVPRKRVGSLVYIAVNGEVQKSGSVSGKPVAPFSFSKTIPLTIQVTNTGGIHFTSDITFSVTDVTGKEVHSAALERIILPSTEREVSADWMITPSAGIYTVHREATVAGELVTLDDETIVIITPWFLLFFGAFLASTITLLVLRTRQRKRKKSE